MALLRVLQTGGCVVPVLAVWAFSFWSRRRLKLDFVDCDIMGDRPIGTPCAEHWLMPSLWTPYFYGSVYARAEEIKRNGSTPVLVHIGAADFGLDLRMYWPLTLALTSLVPRLVLIEPQTRLLPALKERATMLRHLNEDQLAIVNKAVAPICSNSGMRMYCWSERLQELFTRRVPLDVYLTHERDHLLRAAKGAVKDPDNYWSADFARVAYLPNLTDYIEELQFECITATNLLAETGFAAQDIAAMVIDVGGLDNIILDEFLRMPGFQPALVMHDTTVQDRAFQKLWRSLKAHGYLVGATINHMSVVSVHERLFQWPWREGLLRWLRPFVPCDSQTCELARRTSR